MSDAPAVEFAGVSFAYPGGDAALLDVSLRVERGEVLGILGPNGGGKSTLLKLLLGLLTPDSGTIRVMGRAPDAARREGLVGYVPQHAGVNREFPISVRQAIGLNASVRGRSATTTDLVARSIDLVGMREKADAPIAQLSGGQFQRLQIARALAVEPSVLLLDEPTVGIDIAGQQQFAELVERVNREMGATVLLVSHDVRAIASGARRCDRVACLSRTVHFHAAPDGLTPQVLADVFRHDIEGVFGGVHVEAHRAEDCPGDHPHARELLLMLSTPTILGAGAAVALMGGVLSVFVVTKRLAFVGQGVSHAAFGGFGLAIFLGLSAGTLGFYAIVLASCVLAAWGIALIGSSRKVDDDSAIGIVLVAAMSIGSLLVYLRSRQPNPGVIPSWEEFLFGSVLFVSPAEAIGAGAVCAAVCLAVWFVRRSTLLWAMDEEGAKALGLRTGMLRALLLTLLAIAIVVSMRLVGVVLATALLILPGAIALRMSNRLSTVFVISIASALIGTVGGLWVSLERDLLPGPSVVLVLVGMLALAAGIRTLNPVHANAKGAQSG